MPRYIAVQKCPTHGIWSISVDGERGGTRLTPLKCCGRWDLVHRWQMTPRELREMAEELHNEASDLEAEIEGPQE